MFETFFIKICAAFEATGFIILLNLVLCEKFCIITKKKHDLFIALNGVTYIRFEAKHRNFLGEHFLFNKNIIDLWNVIYDKDISIVDCALSNVESTRYTLIEEHLFEESEQKEKLAWITYWFDHFQNFHIYEKLDLECINKKKDRIRGKFEENNNWNFSLNWIQKYISFLDKF